MKKWAAIGLFALFGLSACAARVELVDMSTVPQSERAAAAKVRLLPLGVEPPANFDYIGPVEGNSCKHMLWDKPSSQSDAIEQLRINALRMGATAVTDFSCTPSGTDAYGTDCWNAVHCGGTAIH